MGSFTAACAPLCVRSHACQRVLLCSWFSHFQMTRLMSWSQFPISSAYKQEVMETEKNNFAFYFPSLVWSVQAKLQLADARQWPAVCRQGSPAKPRWAYLSVCVCACVYEWVHMCIVVCVCVPCAFVLWCCSCLAFWFIFRFLCACACTVIKPELSPSHLTTEEHEVEKYKEEEQIQLLLEADGRSAPWKYVNKYL